MTWFNEPASSKVNGDVLTVRSKPTTDLWQKTFDGYAADMLSDLVYGIERDLEHEVEETRPIGSAVS